MKSIVCVLLVLSVLLSMTACGNEQTKSETDRDETSTTQSTDTKPSSDDEQTADIAMTVDGVEINKMMYTAALYQVYHSIYYTQGLYQYDQLYGTGVWGQTFPYGDDQTELLLEDYIIRLAKDNLIRQVAVQKMMKEYGIAVDETDLQELREGFKDVDERDMLKYGFDKEAYLAVQTAILEEQALFYTLYGEHGEREIPEEELTAFFEDNYVAYKTIALTDSDEHRQLMQTILDKYNECLDIDTVLKNFDGEPDMQFADTVTGDAALVEAVKTVDVGTAKIVSYTLFEIEDYVALIYRYDAKNVKIDRRPYFDNTRQDECRFGLKYDEFDAEVKALIASFTVEYHDETVDLIKPKGFLEIDNMSTEDEKDPAEYEGDLRLVAENGDEWILTENVENVTAMWQMNDTTGEKEPIVSLAFDEEGTQKFADATRKNIYKTLSIYIGDELISAPTVNAVISSGEVVITVSDYDEAERLAAIIEAAAR